MGYAYVCCSHKRKKERKKEADKENIQENEETSSFWSFLNKSFCVILGIKILW